MRRTASLLTLASCFSLARAKAQPVAEPPAGTPEPRPLAGAEPPPPAEIAPAPSSPAAPPAPLPESGAAPALPPGPSANTSAAPPPTALPAVAPSEPESNETPFAAPSAEVHGFVSQGFIKTTRNNYLAESKRGSFEFSEVGLNVTATPMDNLRIGAQLFAHDLGPLGNYSTRFDWFYLDYRFRDWLGLRAGRTKIPFGLYNETNDVDAGRVPILLPQSVYPIQNRDFLLAQTGGELYGTVPLGGAGDVEYRGYGGTLFMDPADNQNTFSNPSVPYLLGGRLMWQTPVDGLQAGGSLQSLRLDGDVAPTELAALKAQGTVPAGVNSASFSIHALLGIASVEYSAHDLLLATEYSRWRSRIESDVPTLVQKEQSISERFYVMGSYRVSPWFVPGVYYSLLFSDIDLRRTPGKYQHDVTGTLRFDINPHWLVKLEGHFMHGTGALSTSLNGNAPLDTLAPNWGLFLIKTTAYF